MLLALARDATPDSVTVSARSVDSALLLKHTHAHRTTLPDLEVDLPDLVSAPSYRHCRGPSSAEHCPAKRHAGHTRDGKWFDIRTRPELVPGRIPSRAWRTSTTQRVPRDDLQKRCAPPLGSRRMAHDVEGPRTAAAGSLEVVATALHATDPRLRHRLAQVAAANLRRRRLVVKGGIVVSNCGRPRRRRERPARRTCRRCRRRRRVHSQSCRHPNR